MNLRVLSIYTVFSPCYTILTKYGGMSPEKIGNCHAHSNAHVILIA
jgi:hypothetical protein